MANTNTVKNTSNTSVSESITIEKPNAKNSDSKTKATRTPAPAVKADKQKLSKNTEVSRSFKDAEMPKPVTGEKTPDSPVVLETTVVPRLVTDMLTELHDDFRLVSDCFISIGLKLYKFRENKYYKTLGYKRFDDFVLTEFGLSKATAYSFINVACKFTVLDTDGSPTLELKEEFQKFSSSQLVVMLSLDDETLKDVKPTNSVRDIKALKKKKETSLDIDSDDNSRDDSDKAESKVSSTKVGKDVAIPVNRLFMGCVNNVDDLDRFKPILDKYIKKRKTDKVNYRIEINVIWEQDENLASLEGVE